MSSDNVGFTGQVARETGLKRAGLGIMIRRGSQHARRAAGAASNAGVKHKRRSTVRKLFDKSRFSNLRDFAKNRRVRCSQPPFPLFTMASFDSISAAIGALRVPGSAKGVSRSAIKGALGDVTSARVNLGLKKVRVDDFPFQSIRRWIAMLPSLSPPNDKPCARAVSWSKATLAPSRCFLFSGNWGNRVVCFSVTVLFILYTKFLECKGTCTHSHKRQSTQRWRATCGIPA